MLFKSCTIASKAFLIAQSLGPLNGAVIHTQNVLVLQPCAATKIVGTVDSTRPDQMNSVLYERAWVRVDAMRKWMVLG